jgi:hypothetical protein
LVIPQLQPGDNVIPQLVNIIQTVKGWDAFSTFKSFIISCFLTKNLSPGIGGAPSQALYLKNGTVEIFLNGGDGFPRVKLPKISRLFDNNLSRSVGALPFKSQYLKNDAVENFLDVAVAFSTFKCHKISHLFDKSLSPGVGRVIRLSPSFFPNLTSLTVL